MNERIRYSATAKILEIIGWLALAVLILIPALWYSRLPEQIPTHFGMNGLPDDYSGKAAIWALPVVGTFLFLGLTAINLFIVARPSRHAQLKPHELAMLPKIILLMQLLKTLLILAFVYIIMQAIRVSNGEATGLGAWFLPVFIGLMFILPPVFLVWGRRRPL
ncbi:MAG: DUF1648 domain-containing protein [Clostridia bacterium]|nr:DUF1648 domain-containing protein [Clostridia bacterium]